MFSDEPNSARLARQACEHFDDLSDYTWKTPRLIDHEYELEREKLEAYFPLSGDLDADHLAMKLRAYRWSREERKLLSTFPSLMANSNLYLAASLFEVYCCSLGKLVERKNNVSITCSKGQGLSRLLEFFKCNGVNHKRAPFFEQATAAITIRNCIYHANGLLAWSRDESRIRHIVEHKSYIPAKVRHHQAKTGETLVGIDHRNGTRRKSADFEYLLVFCRFVLAGSLLRNLRVCYKSRNMNAQASTYSATADGGGTESPSASRPSI